MADAFSTLHRVLGDQAADVGYIVENHETSNSASNEDPLEALVGSEQGEK